MPVMRCKKNGKSGWKWGRQGHCYVSKNAKELAARQGRAIHAQKK